MGITMSEASVDQSKRNDLLDQNLRKSELGKGENFNTETVVDKSFFGFNLKTHKETTGYTRAGITAEFLGEFEKSIGTYSDNVTKAIENLNKVKDNHMNEAFKGTQISTAIDEFIESVKQVAFSYLNALQDAESQIAQSVNAAYQQQDTDLSSNLRNDSSTLVDAGPASGQ